MQIGVVVRVILTPLKPEIGSPQAESSIQSPGIPQPRITLGVGARHAGKRDTLRTSRNNWSFMSLPRVAKFASRISLAG